MIAYEQRKINPWTTLVPWAALVAVGRFDELNSSGPVSSFFRICTTDRTAIRPHRCNSCTLCNGLVGYRAESKKRLPFVPFFSMNMVKNGVCAKKMYQAQFIVGKVVDLR